MHFKVIVVGAGLAGLAALGRLRDIGIYCVMTLEARNDVGGRVRMTEFAGSRFNIGPEWLHGHSSNPIYQLVSSKLKLRLRDCHNYTYCLNEPKSMSFVEREMVFRKRLKEIEEEIDRKLMAYDADILQGKSVSDVIGLLGRHNESGLDNLVKYWAFDFENGSSASDYSALIYKMSSKIFENVPLSEAYYFEDNDGFSKVVQDYSSHANITDENIVFDDPVRNIRCWKDRVEVITQKNQIYTSDFCILTAPIPVINRKQITIFPPLDKDVLNAIQKIYFSDYVRVFVEFSHGMRIPDFDWFMDLNFNRQSDIPLWQNPKSKNPVLIAHVCEIRDKDDLKIKEKVEKSLENIFGKDLTTILNIKVVSLADSRYSFGAFPCAAADFNKSDTNAFEKLGENSRLQFAGDGYTLDYFGTVQGAITSGYKAAERIKLYMTGEVMEADDFPNVQI